MFFTLSRFRSRQYAELHGCHLVLLFEEVREVGRVVESAFVCDGAHGLFGVFEQSACFLQTYAVEEVVGGHSSSGCQSACELRAAHAQFRCQVVDAQLTVFKVLLI